MVRNVSEWNYKSNHVAHSNVEKDVEEGGERMNEEHVMKTDLF